MALNQDELVGPVWLDDAFFLKVLREMDNDPSIELTNGCVLRPGTKAGDHFASVMFRTTVTYRSEKDPAEKSINLIMKTKPEAEGLKKELLEDDELFQIEIRMYSKVLPEMARLLKEIGEEYKYPRFVYGALRPHTIFILEDISYQGWVMDDYIKTFDEMKPIVKNIAMFHAASVMIESNDPQFANDFGFRVTEKLIGGFHGMITKGFGDLIHLSKTDSEFAHFEKPLDSFYKSHRDYYKAIFNPPNTIQCVLIHGDFHFKNMLHQVDESGRHTDTILIDYQICNWTSPAIELYYLLDMIPEQDVKDNHREELIYLYHQQFSDLLKRMGFLGKIPTLLDLQVDLLRCSGLELFHYAVFSSFRYLDITKMDIEALLKGEVDNPALTNPTFKSIMHRELTRFLHQGVLVA